MAAYVIADVEVFDREAIKDYQQRVPETLAPFGGRFLVRGGACETLEGEWQPQRVVVIEFPDAAAAKAWYASPAYQAVLPIRLRNSRARFLLLAEGV
ncbi:MAG TPA: DUF1330 domain-containing protein [Burkholderiales bacterium]